MRGNDFKERNVATATRQTRTEQAEEKQDTAPKTHRYVVLSDAVVVTTGKKANGKAEYTRVLAGGLLNGSEESEQIQAFLKAKAIMRVTSPTHLEEVRADLKQGVASKHRQTVRKASQAMGAPDDPVAAPDPAVLPVSPTTQGVEQILAQSPSDE